MAAGNADDKYSTQKLEGRSNWWTWNIQIKAVLMEKMLWNHVDGTARLENGAAAPVREKFENQQHSAYTKLIMLISCPNGCPLPNVCDCSGCVDYVNETI